MADGVVILSEQMNSDECYTVVSGCAVQVKIKGVSEICLGDLSELRHQMKEIKKLSEGQTFNEFVLEVFICPQNCLPSSPLLLALV